jgi:hydroxymethylbilane synthase
MKDKLRVGTRRSALAKTQTRWVVQRLEEQGIECEIVEITSHGDQDRSQPLYEIEASGPGLFTKQLEQALLSREIDLAVHSLKDLPTLQPTELTVLAVPQREEASDVLICRRSHFDPNSPWGIRPGSRVGTSSLRREALLLSKANVRVASVRGNVPTRVQIVQKGELDAVVLADAGLNRLGLQLDPDLIRHSLGDTLFVSAPGQGALGIEGRQDLAPSLAKAVRSLQHEPTAAAVKWERHVLRELEGGCTLPLGVRCQQGPRGWQMHVFLGIAADGIAPTDKGTQAAWLGFHQREYNGTDPAKLASEAIGHFAAILKR